MSSNKYYLTVPLPISYRALDFSSVLRGSVELNYANSSLTATKTIKTEGSSEHYTQLDVDQFATHLSMIGNGTMYDGTELKTKLFCSQDRHTLYDRFPIPKKSGGLRWINAPCPELKSHLTMLRDCIEQHCKATYHTNAFAYIKGRSTVNAVDRHKQARSKWFLKVDLHDFFGSTTKEFTLSMLSLIEPFNRICFTPIGEEVLSKALDLAFLDDGLPQGTPVSPLLSNLVMLPFDYEFSKKLRSIESQKFTYTRYADDMIISARGSFNPNEIKAMIRDTFKELGAPYEFQDAKTHYGSSSGNNWILGLMLNGNNEITVGHRTKKRFRAMCHNFICDCRSGNPWNLEDVQHLQGLLSYYESIEPDYIASLIAAINDKHNADLRQLLKQSIRHY